MTRDELYQILRNYVGRDAEALHAVEEIWGQPFDGETEKINSAKSASSTSEIPQTNPAPFVSETAAQVEEFKAKMGAISQAHEMWLHESFPDGTTYTDRRDSETPNQPQ
jgi:hypothetical protein